MTAAMLHGLLVTTALLQGTGGGSLAETMRAHGLVDAQSQVPGLRVALAYAGNDNFLGKAVYGDLRQCFLQPAAAAMLAKATAMLRRVQPTWGLLAYDCARPQSVQRQMWDIVAGTPQERYVADPNTEVGSIHNYGCAIDLTLADAEGKPRDMGTPFDFFGPAANPRQDIALLRADKLRHAQLSNRLLLRYVMVSAGFYPINDEWWHFNCTSAAEARKRYRAVP